MMKARQQAQKDTECNTSQTIDLLEVVPLECLVNLTQLEMTAVMFNNNDLWVKPCQEEKRQGERVFTAREQLSYMRGYD